MERLAVLTCAAEGRIGLDGLPNQPPLLGADGRYFGHEWSRWRTDTLDRRVDALLAARPGCSVLDVGCATGARAAQFAASGFAVTALDTVDRTAAIAERNSALPAVNSTPIRFVCGDCAALPAALLTPPFAMVHARRVLNFVPGERLGPCLAGFRDALGPGGTIVASFIAGGLHGFDLASRRPPGTARPVHLHRGLEVHDLGEFCFVLEQQGLRVMELFSDGLAEAGVIALRP